MSIPQVQPHVEQDPIKVRRLTAELRNCLEEAAFRAEACDSRMQVPIGLSGEFANREHQRYRLDLFDYCALAADALSRCQELLDSYLEVAHRSSKASFQGINLASEDTDSGKRGAA